MAIHVDSRAGSRNLIAPLQEALRGAVEVIAGQYATDVEFIGDTGIGPTPLGIEVKLIATGDIFTSMTDGRLTGTQLPAMVAAYPWVRYLVVEGSTRRARDGVLEISKRGGGWEPAYSRGGAGWTYREYHNRVRSITEFFSWPHCPGRTEYVETYDLHETVAWIADCYQYWQKPYTEHSSARQWDRSRDDLLRTANPLIRTREIPLVQLWAAAIEGIGPLKSAYVADRFKTPIALANGTEAEWAEVEWRDKARTKRYHFSAESVRLIRAQIAGDNGKGK